MEDNVKTAVADNIPVDERTRLVISQPGSNYKVLDFVDEEATKRAIRKGKL